MEQSNAKLNRCDLNISRKESSFLHSVYSVDGHDRKRDREMSFTSEKGKEAGERSRARLMRSG